MAQRQWLGQLGAAFILLLGGVAGGAISGAWVSSAHAALPRNPGEITVRRINVVGPDGKLQLVISNRQDMPEGKLDGKVFESQGRHDNAGFIFYNSLGDEDGGLTFGAKKSTQGYSADGGLMFDQFKQDQIVGLTYDENDGKRQAGLQVWQRPDVDLAIEAEKIKAMRAMPAGPAKEAALTQFKQDQAAGKYGSQRLFAGQARDQSSAVVLSDAAGHPRLRLRVSAAGAAEIDFLNAEGQLVQRLTPQQAAHPPR